MAHSTNRVSLVFGRRPSRAEVTYFPTFVLIIHRSSKQLSSSDWVGFDLVWKKRLGNVALKEALQSHIKFEEVRLNNVGWEQMCVDSAVRERERETTEVVFPSWMECSPRTAGKGILVPSTMSLWVMMYRADVIHTPKTLVASSDQTFEGIRLISQPKSIGWNSHASEYSGMLHQPCFIVVLLWFRCAGNTKVWRSRYDG